MSGRSEGHRGSLRGGTRDIVERLAPAQLDKRGIRGAPAPNIRRLTIVVPHAISIGRSLASQTASTDSGPLSKASSRRQSPVACITHHRRPHVPLTRPLIACHQFADHAEDSPAFQGALCRIAWVRSCLGRLRSAHVSSRSAGTHMTPAIPSVVLAA